MTQKTTNNSEDVLLELHRLRAENASLRSLLYDDKTEIYDKMYDGLLILDAEFKIVAHNQAAVKIYGTQKLIGRNIQEFLVQEIESEPDEYRKELIKRKHLSDYSGAIFAEDSGEIRYLDVNATALFDQNGVFVGSRDIVKDVTERVNYEKSLRKELKRSKLLLSSLADSNKKLNEFARFASHDLKVPLQGIFFLSEMLMESCAENLKENQLKDIQLINKRSETLLDLVDGILDYATSSADHMQSSLIDFGEVLEKSLRLITLPSGMQVKIPENMPKAYANPELILQVFYNLIQNAVNFMDKPNGLIEVLFEDEPELIRFQIKDNGPGIAAERQTKIFKIFEKFGDKSNKGIGLAIVKRNVEIYGGSVSVQSVLGEGTCFTFYFKKDKLIDTSLISD